MERKTGASCTGASLCPAAPGGSGKCRHAGWGGRSTHLARYAHDTGCLMVPMNTAPSTPAGPTKRARAKTNRCQTAANPAPAATLLWSRIAVTWKTVERGRVMSYAARPSDRLPALAWHPCRACAVNTSGCSCWRESEDDTLTHGRACFNPGVPVDIYTSID